MTWLWTLVCAPKFFPTMLSILDLAAAARYGFCADWGRVMYWTCAAGITFSATWMMK